MNEIRIAMWSGPRNLSTAMMRSFENRQDTAVLDEPFYAHYLRVSGREHPGYQEVLNSQNQYSEQVIEDVIQGEYATPVVFFKQMCF